MGKPKRKICKECGVEKGLRQFNVKSDNADRRRSICRPCQRKSNSEYRKTPEGKLRQAFHKAKWTAKQYGVKDTLTFAELKDTFGAGVDHGCVYCGEPLGDDWSLEHIIPFSKGGTNEIHNIVFVHTSENIQKYNRPPIGYLKADDAMSELSMYMYVMSSMTYSLEQIQEMLTKGTIIDDGRDSN